MSNVRLRWDNSVVTTGHKPLAATIIEGRMGPTLPWAELNRVAIPDETLLLEQVAAGTWEYRATEIDVDGKLATNQPTATVIVGPPVVVEDLPPAGVTSFSATVEP